jgi:ribosomal protein L13E
LTDVKRLGSIFSMSEIIYPRSPREVMTGWMHLPRYIDKIRLHLAGKLHEDYRENFGKGFDVAWLKAAGLTHEQFVEVVKGTVIDGQVADWVLKNVRKNEAEKKAHAEALMNYPKPDDEAMQARMKMRKEQAGLSHRDDIKRFVDFIDADEKRT